MDKQMQDKVIKTLAILISAGISPMPCDSNKKPVLPKWTTKTNEQCEKAIRRWKYPTIGIRTGKTSNIFVLDIDKKDRGLEIWEQLEDKYGEIDTYIVQTPSGGRHLYFSYEGTSAIKSATKVIKVGSDKVGIDVRNDGAQVIAPPSSRDGIEYEENLSLTDFMDFGTNKLNLPRIPDWLMGLLTKQTTVNESLEIIPFDNKPKQVDVDDSEISIAKDADWVCKLVGLLKQSRADDHDDWLNVIFALKNFQVKTKIKTKAIALQFSQLSESFDADSKKRINGIYKDEESPEKPITIHTVEWMAKQDNPTEYAKLKESITYECTEQPNATSVQDLPKIRSSKPTLSELMKFMQGCYFEVHKSPIIYFCRDNGKIVSCEKPFSQDSCDVPLKDGTICSLKEAYQALTVTPPFTKWNTFSDVTFMPSFTCIPVIEGTLNTFSGMKCKPIKPSADDYANMDSHLNRALTHMKQILCAKDRQYYEFFMDTMAFKIQNLFERTLITFWFLGMQGTGKSLLFDWLFEAMFGDTYHEIDNWDSLFERFNSEQANKLMCVLNEVGSFDGDSNNAGRLKSIQTRKKVKIENKGVNGKTTLPDVCEFIGLTNALRPYKSEIGDRRNCPITVSNEKIGDTAYFDALIEAQTPETASKILYVLLNRDVSKWNRQNLPITDEKRQLTEVSLSSSVCYMIDVCRGEVFDEDDLKNDTFDILSEHLYSSYNVWTRDRGEKPKPQRVFAMELTRLLQLSPKSIRKDGQVRRGYRFPLELVRNNIRTLMRDPNYKLDAIEDD